MRGTSQVLLYFRIVWELIRYDLLFAMRGLRGVRQWRGKRAALRQSVSPVAQAAVCEAVRAVAPFYWKPIRCLQRSIVTARLLEGYGVAADVVIGYRAAPFFSHAWVEVGGRVANDAQRYQSLQVLERL